MEEIKTKEIFVDVRSREEYRKKKLVSYSLNIPLSCIEENVEFLAQFEKVKLVCVSGTRAIMAQDILEDNGIFNSVVELIK